MGFAPDGRAGIEPADASDPVVGPGNIPPDPAWRDYAPGQFLAQVVKASDPDPVLFAMHPADAPPMLDAILADPAAVLFDLDGSLAGVPSPTKRLATVLRPDHDPNSADLQVPGDFPRFLHALRRLLDRPGGGDDRPDIGEFGVALG